MTQLAHRSQTLPDALAQHAEDLREDFRQLDMAERDAALRGLRIGLRLEAVKEMLPHGQFEAWRNKAVTEVRERQCRYLQALARRFVDQQKPDAAALQAIFSGGSEPVQRKAEQLLLDFIGGRTQAELLEAFGIRTGDPKPMGGARVAATDSMTPQQRERHFEKLFTEKWSQMMGELRAQSCKGRTYQYLPRYLIEAIVGTLEEARKEIMPYLNAMPKGKDAKGPRVA